ncbi:vWA domain-containing protein [Aestuariibaculum sediminum]|uniref:VWA domain-containing protein n=1 Tax=Aestuariibaculum sediminum TaxID=2770637 RepID=A0A8J6Q0B2_9FLAO|nr:vWA domain-containing protein [Aestuariibaculum sediminum]MBD0833033.1 VWA domain-containing protein [Aestuariibaculum sediminum]
MKHSIKRVLLLSFILNIIFCHAKIKTSDNRFKSTNLNSSQHYIKVALLLDTSNSMDGLIDQAKAQLWDIVNELSYAKCGSAKPNLQIALYEYGNDGLNSQEGFIRQVLPFSEDLDEISKELFSLTTNGGNEYCGHVIQTALNQLNWGKNPEDLKLIFIAGNEPFTQGKVNYKDAATNANEKDVTVNTIFCGDYNQGISSYWKDGALLANGDYMAINHNQKTVHIVSPYDDEILILNQKLNKTYVIYGTKGKEKLALQAEQDSNASNYSKANAVKRSVSKSSHFYKNESWDLVDAVELEEVVVQALTPGILPEELKGKSNSEIEAYLTHKGKERKAIQNQINELNQKRIQYVLKQQREKSNELENAMVTAIKSQAEKKNYKWNK